jgi:virulence factor Mce-like protein
VRARILSALALVAVVAAGFGAYELAGTDKDTYTVTADVEQAPNIFEGGRVMVRGVEVGTITHVDPLPTAVRLTLEIDGDVRIPADARLAVVPITLIADRYVQLAPPYRSGPALTDGAHLDTDRTTIPAELDDVLTQLKGLLATVEPRPGEEHGPLARLVRSLHYVMKHRSEALGGTLEGSANVLETLANSESDITGLVKNLDRVFVTLANRSSQIALLNERFSLVAEALAADQQDLEGTIENVGFLSDQAAQLVGESGNELGRSFAQLKVILRSILRHKDELTEGIQWNNVVAQAAGAVDLSGRGLNAYTGRQAPPGSSRAMYNYRLETRDTVSCNRLNVVAQDVLRVNPDAGIPEISSTVLSFIPPAYQDDLKFLVDELIPFCVEFPNESALDTKARRIVRRVVKKVGVERFGQLVGQWLLTGRIGGVEP